MPGKRPPVADADHYVPDATALLAYLAVLRDVPDGDTVAHALTRGLLGPMRAEMGLIYASRPDGATADLVGAYGVGPQQSTFYRAVTVDMRLPGAETLRTGVEKFMPAAKVAQDYPLAAPFFELLPPRGDMGFIPLIHRGAPAGFVVIGFPDQVERTWQLRATLAAMADATTVWAIADAQLRGEQRALATGTPPLEFSPRQRQILGHLREGRSIREIAGLLGYSQATVKADITSASKFLGARGRADLLVKAKRAGL